MANEQERRAMAEAAVAAHYAQLLGIGAPWQVKRATLELAKHKVEIEVEWDPQAPVVCAQCGRECPRHDHAPERRWRHLDVMQFTTLIRARVPRSRCPEHGVDTVRVPWAEPGSRFTLHFEAFAVQVIEACRSLTQAADLLRLNWDSVQRIVERAVARGLMRRDTTAVRRVGLDEKSFGRGQDYISLMTDLDERRVLEVVSGRDTPSALALWQTLTTEQRAAVVAAAMDMGANFAAATRQAAPQAAVVHDKFHVVKHLNEAVDKVRREEHRRLLERGDDSLSGTKFLWLQGASPEGERKLTFDELCERNLKTARAWCHKETFLEFWAQESAEHGGRFFQGLVQRRGAQQTQAAQESRAHPQGASPRIAQLLRTSHHQRAHRRFQLAHPSDQGRRPRLPSLRRLPRSHSLPLWQARHVARYPSLSRSDQPLENLKNRQRHVGERMSPGVRDE